MVWIALNWTRLSCQLYRFVATSVSVRPGVQPWELPSPAVSAQGGPLVAAERAGEAQDGRPSTPGG